MITKNYVNPGYAVRIKKQLMYKAFFRVILNRYVIHIITFNSFIEQVLSFFTAILVIDIKVIQNRVGWGYKYLYIYYLF